MGSMGCWASDLGRPLAATLLSLAAVGCAADDASTGRSVLVIVVDTWRADHLGAYGHDRPTSPHLDAWSAGGPD